MTTPGIDSLPSTEAAGAVWATHSQLCCNLAQLDHRRGDVAWDGLTSTERGSVAIALLTAMEVGPTYAAAFHRIIDQRQAPADLTEHLEVSMNSVLGGI